MNADSNRMQIIKHDGQSQDSRHLMTALTFGEVDTIGSAIPPMPGSPLVCLHLSCHCQEQVPSVESNTLSCVDCDTAFENQTESVTCNGPGCGQAVSACMLPHVFGLCLLPVLINPPSGFTLHLVGYSRSPLVAGFAIGYAGQVPDFGSENSARMIHR